MTAFLGGGREELEERERNEVSRRRNTNKQRRGLANCAQRRKGPVDIGDF